MRLRMRAVSGKACLILLLCGYGHASAQNNTSPSVTGIVRNEAMQPVEGVAVELFGESSRAVTQAVTNEKGVFVMNKVPAGGPYFFVFSHVAYIRDTLRNYAVQEGARATLSFTLREKSRELGAVTVTALGIRRATRSLGYSVEELNGREFNRVTQENFLNAMSGKMAGVTISSTGGAGSSVNMVIRGATSLSSDNQPLFVIDGVPLANTLNNISEIGSNNKVDYGNAISDINMDNIESVTVLKGPSAAALYGSRAGNGVVIITTKTGRRVDRLTVNATQNVVFDIPYKYLEWQTKFGSGQFSAIPVSRSGNMLTNPFGSLVVENLDATYGAQLDMGYGEVQWNSPTGADGKKIPMPLVSHKNNAKDFVNTGITSASNISIANNNDLIAYRMSYANMTNKGIIPNTDLFRNSLNLNATMRLHSKFTVSANVDYSRSHSNNRPAGDRGTNPLQWLYSLSPHININDLRDYWMPGQEGIQQRTQANGVFNNPWFLAYEVNNGFVRDRVFGNVHADWQITPRLSLMVRYALDNYKEERETKIANSYLDSRNGAYGIIGISHMERNADALLTYKQRAGKIDFSVSAGGNLRYQTGKTVSNTNKAGTGLIVPGVFTLQNILPENLDAWTSRYEKGVHSVYGTANIGYRDMLYLDITGRTDWSSTLPNAEPYFYPSTSLSVLADKVAGINHPNINMIKLRGGIAKVGNDASPYQLQAVLANAGAWGNIPRLTTSGTLLNPFLKPEIATSYEGGADVVLFKDRLRFNFTYYVVENKNQIFSTKIPPSSGFSSKNINAGLLRSRGVEITLGGTPVLKKDFRWDVNVNLTRNRTRIVSLTEDMPYYVLWEEGRGGAWTYVGEDIGDIYDAELVTVKDEKSPYYGYPVLDAVGKWQAIDAQNSRNKIGNFNPDFILGGQTTISYKRFSLAMTFDWRNGGDFVSQTYRYGEEHGNSQRFLDKLINPGNMKGEDLANYLKANQDQLIRVNGNYFPLVGGPTPEYNGYPFTYGPYTLPYGGVFIPGVRPTGFDPQGNPTGYAENLGGPGTLTLPYAGSTTWSFTRAFLFPASYLKLREVALSYDIPSNIVKRIGARSAGFSIYSRNIILWTAAKIGVDPEQAYQPAAGVQGSGIQFKQGIERYNVTPWSIPLGFKLNLTF